MIRRTRKSLSSEKRNKYAQEAYDYLKNLVTSNNKSEIDFGRQQPIQGIDSPSLVLQLSFSNQPLMRLIYMGEDPSPEYRSESHRYILEVERGSKDLMSKIKNNYQLAVTWIKAEIDEEEAKVRIA
ncbi:hypothetical protein KW787_03905, partial [Candidatus Pacearchaeota archaeon]|nr:hypothetical protein [Candidatus Pacearchaeota archaeon]